MKSKKPLEEPEVSDKIKNLPAISFPGMFNSHIRKFENYFDLWEDYLSRWGWLQKILAVFAFRPGLVQEMRDHVADEKARWLSESEKE